MYFLRPGSTTFDLYTRLYGEPLIPKKRPWNRIEKAWLQPLVFTTDQYILSSRHQCAATCQECGMTLEYGGFSFCRCNERKFKEKYPFDPLEDYDMWNLGKDETYLNSLFACHAEQFVRIMASKIAMSLIVSSLASLHAKNKMQKLEQVKRQEELMEEQALDDDWDIVDEKEIYNDYLQDARMNCTKYDAVNMRGDIYLLMKHHPTIYHCLNDCETLFKYDRNFVFEVIRHLQHSLTVMPESVFLKRWYEANLVTQSGRNAFLALLKEQKEMNQSVAKSIRGRFKTFVSGVSAVPGMVVSDILSYGKSCIDNTEKYIMQKLEDLFFRCMGPLTKAISPMKAFIETFWSKLRGWLKSFKDGLGAAVACLKEHAMWAFATLVGAVVVLLAEKLLVSLGYISSVGNALGLFLVLAVSAFSFTASNCTAEQINDLTNMIKNVVLGLFCERPSVEKENFSEMRAIFPLDGLISAIHTMGTGLVNCKLSTLQYYAKFGTAFDQLVRGKKAIAELVSWIIEMIGSAYSALSGKKNIFFSDLSALVNIDVKDWLQTSYDLRISAMTLMPGDRKTIEKIENKLNEGRRMTISLAGVKRDLSLNYGMVIRDEIKLLEELYEQVVNTGPSETTRFYPFWVHLAGKSQCGKTNFVNQKLMPELMQALDLPEGSIYDKSKDDEFFSGYKRQACVKIDDINALLGSTIEAKMIDLVNSEPHRLNMGALAEKGKFFDSPLIISTSNELSLPTDSFVRDKGSYHNRRAVVMEMDRLPGTEYDPKNIDACARVRLLQPKQAEYPGQPPLHTPLTDWISPTEAMAEIQNRLADHVKKETDRMAEEQAKTARKNSVHAFAANFLRDLNFSGTYLSEEERLRYGIRVYCTSYLAVDGKLFGYDALHRLHRVDFDTYPGFLETETLDHAYDDVKKLLSCSPHNGLVSAFLLQLVEGQVRVDSVFELGGKPDYAQLGFWNDLKLTERVYLRICQIKFDAFKVRERQKGNVGGKMSSIISGTVKTMQEVAANGYSALLLVSSFIVVLMSCWSLVSLLLGLTKSTDTLSSMTKLSQAEVCAPSIQNLSDRMYRRQNIPIMQRYSNIRSNLDYDEVWKRAAMEIVLDVHGEKNILVNAVHFKGRSLLLTYHQAVQLPDGATVTLFYHNNVHKQHVWKHDNILHFPDTEIVVYQSPLLLQQSDAIAAMFEDDFESIASSVFECSLCGWDFDYDEQESSHVDLRVHGKLVKEVMVLSDNVQQSIAWKKDPTKPKPKYIKEIPKYVELDYESKPFQSGTLVASKFKGKMRIIGMISGCNAQGTQVSLIPQYTTGHSTIKSVLGLVPGCGIATDGIVKLGHLESNVPMLPRKTQLVAVPAQFQIPEGSGKEPSILTRGDPRLVGTEHANYDPYVHGLEKYVEPMDPLDSKDMGLVVRQMKEEWYDATIALESVSMEEAINGMMAEEDDVFEDADGVPMSTSEGYPFMLHRPHGESGKHRFFEGVPGSWSIKEGTGLREELEALDKQLEEGVPELVVVECAKDEKLKKEKVTGKPKTRLFSILPLHYNLLLRKYFLQYSQYMKKNRKNLSCQVGMNCYSSSWKHMLERLLAVNSEGFNCDYKNFDGILTGQMMEYIADHICSAFSDGNNAKRKNLLMAMSERISISGGQVHQIFAGMPSGCALTVIINSILNEMLMRYCFVQLVPQEKKHFFKQSVALMVYGDDNLFTVSPHLQTFFNGNAIKAKLATVGVTITDGKDKNRIDIPARNVWDLEFLKRGFKKFGKFGHVVAPLDLNSIYSSLCWVSGRNGDVMDKLRANVENAARELYLHSEDKVVALLDFYHREIPSWRGLLPTVSQCEAFHMLQLAGSVSWKPTAAVDFNTSPQFEKFVVSRGAGNEVHEILPGFAVAGPFYRVQDDEWVVSSSGTLAGEVRTILNPYKLGSGVGDVPTQAFVRQSFDPKSITNQIIDRARQMGCKRVVFRSNAPYFASWIALIGYTSAFNLYSSRDILTAFGNVGGDQAGLERLLQREHDKSPVCVKIQKSKARPLERVLYAKDEASMDLFNRVVPGKVKIGVDFPCISIEHCKEDSKVVSPAGFPKQYVHHVVGKIVCNAECPGHVSTKITENCCTTFEPNTWKKLGGFSVCADLAAVRCVHA